MSKKGGKGKGGKGKGNKGPTPQTAPPAQQAAPQEVAEVEEPHLPKFPPFDRLSHTPTGPAEAVEPIQKLLGFTLRVTLSDGRIIVGDLSSLDNHRNLILVNTYQAHITAEQTSWDIASTKQMNTTLVPGEVIVKIEVGRSKTPAEVHIANPEPQAS